MAFGRIKVWLGSPSIKLFVISSATMRYSTLQNTVRILFCAAGNYSLCSRRNPV